MIQGARDETSVDAEKATQQAALLYGAGEAKLGTDEDTFVNIIGQVGPNQAHLIFEEYKKISGRTMEQAIRDEFSGELLTGLLALGKARPRHL